MGQRAIVVGGGIMGLSAAWALARRGWSVELFEQENIPNERGSSVDQHRLIRFPYGAEEGYTLMVKSAFDAWARLWSDLGKAFYIETGTFALLGQTHDWAQQSLQTLTRLGTDVQLLRAPDVQKRWPILNIAANEEAFFLPTGGVLLARPIVAALARYLQRRGVSLNTNTAVRDVDPITATITLHNNKTHQADALVIAAGPWTERLCPSLSKRITPSRQVVFYFQPPNPEAWSSMPMLLDIDNGIYAVPPVQGTGLKVGDHDFSLIGNPDDPRTAERQELQAMTAACEKRFKSFSRYAFETPRVCFYTVQPQERFILERHEKTTVMAGFSGHGFKFGALMGEAAAAATLNPDNAHAIKTWAAGHVKNIPFKF